MDDVKSKLTSIDYAILAALPKQGSKLGLRDLAPQVKQVKNNLNEGVPSEARLTGSTISGRMRQLKSWGLVVEVPVTPVSDGRGFQITPEGQAVLNGRAE